MKHMPILLAVAVALTVAVTSCKTTEKNYREAYEKAVADNDRGVTDFDKTIYNRYRGQARDVTANVDGRTVNTRMMQVKVTPDGGGIREWLRKYSVVVAGFKQIFNARSMQKRFVDAGYARTFLVENGEPYYYIVIDSSDDLTPMVNLADSLSAASPVPLKEGFPYILQRP